MRKTLLVLAMLAIAANAFAADAAQGIEKGDKALLFSARGFEDHGFGGHYDFGMKYYVAKGLAIRPVLKFVYQSQSNEIPPDSGGPAVYRWHRTCDDTKTSVTGFGLDLGVEKSVYTSGAVNVHAGGLLGMTFSSYGRDSAQTIYYTNNGTVVAGDGGRDSWKDEGSATTLEIAGLLGAEWFITDNVTLGAEYHLGLSRYSEGEDKGEFSDGTDNGGAVILTTYENPKTTTTTFGFQTIGLVLGIRF
ncbi:MAG: hypothetical protein MUF78_03015 [Candidatus Edwardsbacteria bacterium]|jgi:hypothetical protein|nr:hypothetical protein [Candidatus Edwardsbacteria bacterium]